ncbi:hypothetical protein JCM11957_06120 [Caminibacter profundus]
MTKLFKTLLVSGVFLVSTASADYFVGAKIGGGSGKVSVSSSSGNSYTFTDSDSISTTDTQIYVGKGRFYLFYQTGKITTDSKYIGDFDYNAFGIGYYYPFQKKFSISSVKIQPEFMIGIGYDSLTGKSSGTYDDDKTGILIPMSLGVSVSTKSFESIKLTADMGYDIHVVNDSTSTSYDGSWNFSGFRYNVGVRYSF